MQDSSQVILPVASETTFVQPVRDTVTRHMKKPARISASADSAARMSSTKDSSDTVILVKKYPDAISPAVLKTKPISFFGQHELKVIHHGPQSLNRFTPDWVFPLLIIITLAFTLLRTYYNKYFTLIITAFFNNNLTNQIVRDENILIQRASVLLNITFNLMAALFLYFVSVHLRWPLWGIGTGLNRYLFFTLVVSGAYTMKFLVLKICGYLFKLDKEMAAYIFNIFLINNVLGIVLIPIVAILAFSIAANTTWVINGAVILAASAFLYRVIRGVLVGITSPVSHPYYLFLYLCTLEFAPLMVLIKILNQR